MVPEVIFIPFPCLILTGKIEFTWQEVMIGFESSLLMFPINLLIVQIFRNTRPWPAMQGTEKKPGKNGRVSPGLPPPPQVTPAISLTPEAVIKVSAYVCFPVGPALPSAATHYSMPPV